MTENYEKSKYVLVGAILRCSFGSHPRKLNLINSHGLIVKGLAVVTGIDKIGEFDNKVIGADPRDTPTLPEKCNIRIFGVCYSPNNPSTKSNIKFATYDSQGKEITPVKGKQCCVQIDKGWINEKDNTLINDFAAITKGSFLMCKFGGKIEVIDHGQD